MIVEELVSEIHQDNKDRGWWEGFTFPLDVTKSEDRSVVVEKLCLIHSEVSEALEEVRAKRPFNETYLEGKKPCGFPSELADTIIRVLDLAAACGIDIVEIINKKLEYNRTRGYRYGGKAL